jgi:hypothetical protein
MASNVVNMLMNKVMDEFICVLWLDWALFWIASLVKSRAASCEMPSLFHRLACTGISFGATISFQKMFSTFPIEDTQEAPAEEGKSFPGPDPDSELGASIACRLIS